MREKEGESLKRKGLAHKRAKDGGLAQCLAGELFCKNRYFGFRRSILVGAGLCVAKTGISDSAAPSSCVWKFVLHF